MFEGLTNKGKEYMAKCLAENKPVSFAKVKIGDGTIGHGENPETFIDIKSIKKEVSIVDKTQIGDTAKLTVQLDNTGVLEGYFPREIGIYVQDGGQEILYWYINDGSETSWLPPASKSPVKFKYHINLMVTNLETVIVNWSGKELWVDREYLGKELDKKLNNGNLPSIVTNAETIFKALQGNTGIKFDENLLYLNDSGTKKKGYCYIDKLTDGIFECIQETTTTVNNATYFKNFSNKENSDRLSNLIDINNKSIIRLSIKTLQKTFYFENGWFHIDFDTPFQNECICVLLNDDGAKEYQSFTIGNISKNGCDIQVINNKTYSSGDKLKIIAFGY